MSSKPAYLGTLGDRSGVNVARVEVSWYDEETDKVDVGYYIVHARGDEPEVTSDPEFGTIYNVFENLVGAEMDAKVEAGKFTSWETEDTSSV